MGEQSTTTPHRPSHPIALDPANLKRPVRRRAMRDAAKVKRWLEIFERDFINNRAVMYCGTRGDTWAVDVTDETRLALINSHLTGERISLSPRNFKTPKRAAWKAGAANIDADGRTRWGVIDLDGANHADALPDPLGEAQKIEECAKVLGIPIYFNFSSSGQGVHARLFFEQPSDAAAVIGILKLIAPKGVETFPKQERAATGNQVWLPLYHAAQGDGGEFFRFTGEGIEIYEPTSFDKISPENVARLAPIPEHIEPKPANNGRQNGGSDDLWIAVNSSVDIPALISSLQLPPYSSHLGGKRLSGHCPTGHPSTGGKCCSIDVERGLWHCFHCGAGGAAVQFVIAAKPDFKPLDAARWLIENHCPQHAGLLTARPDAKKEKSPIISVTPDYLSGEELDKMEFPETRWAVPGLIPEGYIVLAGKPKAGKSWELAALCADVAEGKNHLGKFPTIQGDALFLALEDSHKRMQGRLREIMRGAAIPRRLTVTTKFPRWDQGGMEELCRWLEAHPEARIVGIDTAQKIKPPKPKDVDPYSHDYAFGAQLQAIGLKFHVGLVGNLHQRKAKSDDIFDTISGTYGNTAAADVLAVLIRKRNGEGELHLTGRDIPETAYSLTFDAGRWMFAGTLEDGETSKMTRAIAWLTTALRGGPQKSENLFADAAVAGISRSMLFDAKKEAGNIKVKKCGYDDGWAWHITDILPYSSDKTRLFDNNQTLRDSSDSSEEGSQSVSKSMKESENTDGPETLKTS